MKGMGEVFADKRKRQDLPGGAEPLQEELPCSPASPPRLYRSVSPVPHPHPVFLLPPCLSPNPELSQGPFPPQPPGDRTSITSHGSPTLSLGGGLRPPL